MHTERYGFWKVVGSQAVQDIVERIDDAYDRFFKDHKKGLKTRPPGFKPVHKYKSFTLKQASWKLLGDNKIQLHKSNYKFVNSPPTSRENQNRDHQTGCGKSALDLL